jgi:Arc/MetJ family transcription regulator
MARTTVNIDDHLLAEAKKALGTEGVTETINAAMADVARRAELAKFSVSEFDITDEDLADARRDRVGSDG